MKSVKFRRKGVLFWKGNFWK